VGKLRIEDWELEIADWPGQADEVGRNARTAGGEVAAESAGEVRADFSVTRHRLRKARVQGK
jgi:hypothetical protein